ncbi:MAG: LysM peptidoglycan-binding domain-containing protein [Victivallaceae bacterium]|nr:LysM peptidoglycan-binding domain-containing protein [Victivallaceae bacterium]
MKYGLTFAAIAVVVLAGCQSEVLDSRKFAPVDENTYAAPAASDNGQQAAEQQTDQQVQEVAPAQDNVTNQSAQKQPETTNYAPMTGVKSSGGVSGKVGAAAAGTYVVCAGDTLGKIAHKQGVKLKALMDANGLDERSARKIRVGQKLIIPNGKTAAKAKPAAKSAPASKEPATPPALEADGRYKVKRGDSPAKIAKRFKVKVDDLMAANGLNASDASRMQIGDLLIIPGITKGVSAANASTKSTETTEQLKEQVVELPNEQPQQQQAAAPENTDTVVVEEVSVTSTAPKDNEDLMADTLMYEVQEESISFADLAIKLNVSVENLRKNNPEATDPVKRGFSVFYSQEK